MANYESLDEFLTGLDNYSGGWPAYQQRYSELSPNNRVVEMVEFDKLFENECRPSRDLGQYITMRRWMHDTHDLLQRGGR
jgi:hypothetical protein